MLFIAGPSDFVAPHLTGTALLQLVVEKGNQEIKHKIRGDKQMKEKKKQNKRSLHNK